MSAPSIFVPKVSRSLAPLLRETLQDQQVGLAQAPVKLLLLPWVLVCMGFCLCHFKSKVFISPSPVGLLQLSPAGLQSHVLGAHLPSARPLSWGARCGAQDSHSCGRTSAV